jgi:hypothetical protein
LKYLPFIITSTFLYPQDLEIIPVLEYGYESDSEEYHLEDVKTHDFEVDVLGRYSRGKLNIQTYLAYHFLQGPIHNQSQFTPVQGLHWVRKDPGLGENQKNYYVSDMQVQYGDSSSYIYLNKWNKHWGPGVRSLTVSNKIPTFPYFGLTWSLNEQIRLEYFHGQLRSGIVDSSYLNYFASGKSPQIMRNIAGHRLDWQPNKKWNLGISELVIYANRSLEMAYLLPFIPFFPIQNYLNDTDNIVMSADVQYFYQNNIRIYGAFLMDEWSPPYTLEKDNHNWFGWQTGIDWNNIYLEKGSNTLSTPWGNSDNKDDPFPKPPVTDHALLVTSVSWFWKYARLPDWQGIVETGWSNYDFPNKIAFSDPESKTEGSLFLKAQFYYDFGFNLQ